MKIHFRVDRCAPVRWKGGIAQEVSMTPFKAIADENAPSPFISGDTPNAQLLVIITEPSQMEAFSMNADVMVTIEHIDLAPDPEPQSAPAPAEPADQTDDQARH